MGRTWSPQDTRPARIARRRHRQRHRRLESGSRGSSDFQGVAPRAGNPTNALLNYLYAMVEAECHIAALAVRLDPAIGVMHSDLRATILWRAI